MNAYTNAKIQDVVDDSIVMRRHPVRTFLRAQAWLTIPAILFWLRVRDEDWWKELAPWRRFTGFNFLIGEGDRAATVWIPTPFTFAMIFAHYPIAVLDGLYNKDRALMQDWIDRMQEEYVPDLTTVVPDLAEPALEVILNQDLWRNQPIDTESQLRLEPKDRFRDYTTSASKYFGWFLGRTADELLPERFAQPVKDVLGPQRVEHLLHRYSGGLLTDLLKVPEQGFAKALGFGRVIGGMQGWRGQSLNEFYEHKNLIDQKYNSARLRVEQPDQIDAALREQHRELDEIADFMAEIRKHAVTIADQNERHKQQRYLTALGRRGLGKEQLPNSYPDPMDPKAKLDPAIEKMRSAFLQRRVYALTAEKLWDEQPGMAVARLKKLGLDQDGAIAALRKRFRSQGWATVQSKGGKITSYGERVRRIRKAFKAEPAKKAG